MEKKILMGLFFLGIVFFSLSSVLAISLKVTPQPVQTSVITDLDEPASFDLVIENFGDTDTFQLYSFVGVDITPKESFIIKSGETKTISIKVMPQDALKAKKQHFTFEYKIGNSKNEFQTEKLTIDVIGLEQAFEITPEAIYPSTEKEVISIKNKIGYNFGEISAKLDSVFFNSEAKFSLEAYQTKNLEINLNKDKLKSILSGPYLLTTKLETHGKSAEIESTITFSEQEGIDSKETSNGFFINKHEITKSNIGNVQRNIQITVNKNILAYLFTTFNIAPEKTFNWFTVTYTWRKELMPNQELDVVVKTNWFYPIIVIILAIVIFMGIKKYTESDLIVKKNVSFVNIKGGEFALRVSIRLRAKKFIERISVIDRLPALVTLYDKFGAIPPNKVDLKNKRLEWNVESLDNGEERIFSYIIYSKVGVFGRFELPSSRALYSRDGKLRQVESNRAFLINQGKKKQEF
jgi:hypothetical protein